MKRRLDSGERTRELYDEIVNLKIKRRTGAWNI